MKPKIIRSLEALRRETGNWRAEGKKYALIPTMGALHDGHLKLVEEGFNHADRTLVSIFINPKQFGPTEDLDRYPRDEAGDITKLGSVGTNLIFIPDMLDIYGPDFATGISIAGPAKVKLEDKYRPHFFDGVVTIVAKLFNMTSADVAMFGEKDYQQLKVVSHMARDLNMPTKVIGVPTIRAEDGLALSSRNRYLSKTERTMASALYKNLKQAAERIRGGSDPQIVSHSASRSLTTQGFKVDYFTARDAETLTLPERPNQASLRLLVAAWLGTTRLIDNLAV